MAEQTTSAPTEAPAGKPDEGAAGPKKAPSKLLLPLVVALATVLGGVVGVVVVAPKLIASRAKAEAKKVEEANAAGEEKKEGKAAEKGPLLKIDNLIVNPAGSQGSRFLMVSVAIETTSGQMDEALRRQEPEIRDILIALLEKQTMESLGRPGIRDSLKEAIADTVTALAKSPRRLAVFLPQFVIQ